jgi:hypothetical protein
VITEAWGDEGMGRVPFLGALQKFRKATVSFVMCVLSVCPREATGLPLEGFSSNLIFEYFSKKNVEKIQFFVRIGQE